MRYAGKRLDVFKQYSFQRVAGIIINHPSRVRRERINDRLRRECTDTLRIKGLEEEGEDGTEKGWDNNRRGVCYLLYEYHHYIIYIITLK